MIASRPYLRYPATAAVCDIFHATFHANSAAISRNTPLAINVARQPLSLF
jgi:hypothetical protein